MCTEPPSGKYYSGNWPKTKDEWWALVDAHWLDLLHIMQLFLPMQRHMDIDELREAELSNLVAMNSNAGKSPIPMFEIVERLHKEHDPALARYLSEAWWRAPDREEIHSLPNWCLLCDLLSEEPGCLEPEEGKPDLVLADQKDFIEGGVVGVLGVDSKVEYKSLWSRDQVGKALAMTGVTQEQIDKLAEESKTRQFNVFGKKEKD